MIMGDTTLHNPAVNWRKMSARAPHKEITWSNSGKVIGSEAKYPRSVLKIKGEIALYLLVVVLCLLSPL